MKREQVSLCASQHTGLALAMENIIQFAGLTMSCASLSATSLERRPSCFKKDCAVISSGLTIRSKYVGEVHDGFIYCMLV